MRLKIAALCLVGVALTIAQTALTNDSIVKMLKNGLGDDVIVSTIKAQPAAYSTDPDALIALKTAGVSDKVIAAMVDRTAMSGDAPHADSPAADAKMAVYVYRPRFRSGPPTSTPSVYCDGQELARMQNGRYFGVRLNPGKHSLRSSEGEPVIDLDVKAGQTYYIRLEVVPAGLKAHGRLTLMSADEGFGAVRTLKVIDSDKVKDLHLVVLDPMK